MENDGLTIIISIVAVITSIIALLIGFYTKRDAFYLKKYDSFHDLETSKEIFIGRLLAFGFTEEEVKNDGLSVNELMYYCGLLNTIWIGNKIDSRAKRLKYRFPFFYSKISFERKVQIVKKMDKKREFFSNNTQTGLIIKSVKFQKAWNKYLSKFWSRSSRAKTAVLIEASLSNLTF